MLNRIAEDTVEISDYRVLHPKPVVSIYMAAHNHEMFIADAIEGVVSQKCNFPIELIIGEDCSADNTRKIVLDYQNRYPMLLRIITSGKNVGAHANSSRCLNSVRGEYIAFCEGDDYWHHSEKLKMQLDLMKRNPEMALCHTGFDILTKFRRYRYECLGEKNRWPDWGRNTYDNLLKEWNVKTATTMYRSWVLKEFQSSRYNNDNWPFGDGNKFLFASVKGSVGFIGISTATYRKVAGSAMNQNSNTMLKMKQAHLECVEMFISDYPIDKNIEYKILKNLNLKIYYLALISARSDIMNHCYNELIRIGKNPFPIKNLTLCSFAKMKWLIRLVDFIVRFKNKKLVTLKR